MPYLLMLLGFIFLLYVMSQYMKNSKSPKMNRILRYGFAIAFGSVAYFFLVIAKNIPVGGLLGLLSFLSAQGSLWRLFVSKPTDSTQKPPHQGAGQSKMMSRDEALEILGLSGTPSPSEIKDAHHKMMLKLHPDQGGSDYFASKLNQARDILLSA